MATENIIWLLPLPPLLAFFFIVLFANKSNKWSHIIGVGAAGLSWLGAMVVFFRSLGVEHFGEHPCRTATLGRLLSGKSARPTADCTTTHRRQQLNCRAQTTKLEAPHSLPAANQPLLPRR